MLFIQVGERPAPKMLRDMLAGYLHIPQATADADRVALIGAFLTEHDASGLTCLSYSRMVWLHSHAAEWPSAMPLWIASPEALPVLESKQAQQKVACEVGLPVLKSFFFDKSFNGDIDPDDFPLVLRPGRDAEVEPHFKMTLVNNVDELHGFLESRTRLGAPLIGQHYVNGPNLVVHGARSRTGKHLHLAGFLAARKFNGVSLTIEPTTLPEEIEQACRRFVEKIDYIGIYHFELLWEPRNGKYYFLEINGRLGGTTAKAFACGYDEPSYMIEVFAEYHWPAENYRKNERKPICTNKRAVLRALLETARGNKTVFDYAVRRSIGYPLDLAHGLLTWRDEIFLTGHYRSGLAYTLHATVPDALSRRYLKHSSPQ